MTLAELAVSAAPVMAPGARRTAWSRRNEVDMSTSMSSSEGAVHSSVRRWLRLEGALAFLAGTVLYARGDGSWLVFAALFFAPDVTFAGYVAGPRVGAALYNAAHSYVGPLLLLLVVQRAGTASPIALVWAAHIGFDRALGYGLKYPSAFRDTHLGRLGRSDAPAGVTPHI